MSDLPALLLGSLNPATRKQAEQSLNAYSNQPGFLSHLLRLALDVSGDRNVRLSAAVYVKNIVKTRWEDDEQPIAESDKVTLRAELVPAMLVLTSDKNIRAQVAETVSLVAALDFPVAWPELLDQLVQSLSPSDYNINIGVLHTAHSIFRQWRAHVRSDELFTEINLVLSKFMTPFLQLFQSTADALLGNPSPTPGGLTSATNYPVLGETMVLLTDIYYDFVCQDLPPALEDANIQFFDSNNGYFPRFIQWDSPSLRGDSDDTTPSISSQLKTNILEIVELYIKLFPEQLQATQAVQTFTAGVWSLIGSNRLPSIADDQLVSQALSFISTAIRTGFYKDLFSSRDTISSIVQGVVVPNVSLREHDVEQFEDDPLEFIRLDLALASVGTDLATRRQAAADVVRALVGSGAGTETTEIVGQWISSGLTEYDQNKNENWKSKDSAIYLLTAVATRGSTSQHGVTSTNALVDVVDFFSKYVYQDLESSSIHPILQVDAIRFLFTFRNQLTKPQLLSVLPLLVRQLNSENYVTSTYAAITIDRILSIKQGATLMFGQADIQDLAAPLIDTLLTKISSAGTADKVAENDHMMKCVMRIIITARQSLVPNYDKILPRLISIFGIISSNPSNPRFDQFMFESISGLLRFGVATNPATLPTFESSLFPAFTYIIQNDIDQYIPYVFQVLAQMLELHKSDVPAEYRSLLPFLLTPAMWQQKGSVPGLVKLLKAYLALDARQMLVNGQIASVFAVTQQRLIPSKINDVWGFELVTACVQHVPANELQQFFTPIAVEMMKRMMGKTKTDRFVYLFSRFFLFVMAIQVEGLGPDYLIRTIEEVQPQLWSQVLNKFIIPQLGKMPPKDRKIAVVGIIRMLTESKYMMIEPSVQSWPTAFTALVKLFSEPQHLEPKSKQEVDVGLTEIDYEEATAGYQAAYSRLAASEGAEVDPVDYVQNPLQFVGQKLAAFSTEHGSKAGMLMRAGDSSIVGPFVDELKRAGVAI